MSPARESFAHSGVVAAPAQRVSTFEPERNEAPGLLLRSGRVSLEDLADVLCSRSSERGSLPVHIGQQIAWKPDGQNICHTLMNTFSGQEMQGEKCHRTHWTPANKYETMAE